jgi:uncharacterized membrane protein YccC
MIVIASVAAMSVAVSRRAAIAALNCVLALLIAQGLTLGGGEAPQILILGGAGALAQALLSLVVALAQGGLERPHPIAGARIAAGKVRAELNLDSPSLRHAIRSGIALGSAVAVYHVVDLGRHGYWVPLTVLFVLRAGRADTDERVVMRIVGTFVGLALATSLAVLVGESVVANTAILVVTAACAYAMLMIEYALFAFSITVFIVTLSHAVGESAVQAVDERAIATVIGVVIVLLAFAVWRDRKAPLPAQAQ